MQYKKKTKILFFYENININYLIFMIFFNLYKKNFIINKLNLIKDLTYNIITVLKFSIKNVIAIINF